jgi:hypothetical protein
MELTIKRDVTKDSLVIQFGLTCIEFDHDGNIFKNDKFIETDKDLVNAFRDLVNRKYPKEQYMESSNRYARWILDRDLDSSYVAEGQCMQVTQDMQRTFPELRIAKGIVWSYKNIDNYSSTCVKEYLHCWCVDTEGKIIDPTVAQYCNLPDLQYCEKNWVAPRKCWNCGKYRDTGEECLCDGILKE